MRKKITIDLYGIDIFIIKDLLELLQKQKEFDYQFIMEPWKMKELLKYLVRENKFGDE
jgi:uncharacterized protein (DUF1015 family)